MSVESAKAFIEKMNTDKEFAKRAMEQRGKEQVAAFLKSARDYTSLMRKSISRGNGSQKWY